MVAQATGAGHRWAVEPVNDGDQCEGNDRQDEEGELAGLQIEPDGAEEDGRDRDLGEFGPLHRPEASHREEFNASDQIGRDPRKP